MKPWKTLAKERAPDGQELVLQERDGVFVIRVGGHELMSSARHGSEEAMARAGLDDLRRKDPKVLVGGLGLGFTVRTALDLLGPEATVVVAELSRAVVDWNRGPLAHLARAPLEDRRVKVEVVDVAKYLVTTKERFDAILMDVDNGPSALAHRGNERLYGRAGLSAFCEAIRPYGKLVIWSAGPAEGFLKMLKGAGFKAEERQVSAHGPKGKGTQHVLYVARKP